MVRKIQVFKFYYLPMGLSCAHKGQKKGNRDREKSALECVLIVPGVEIYGAQSQAFLPFCKFLFTWEENRKKKSHSRLQEKRFVV